VLTSLSAKFKTLPCVLLQWSACILVKVRKCWSCFWTTLPCCALCRNEFEYGIN